MVSPPSTTRLIVLGATGSVGVQTLEVVEHLNALADQGLSSRRYEVVGLAAGRRADDLTRLAARFNDPPLALVEPNGASPRFQGPDSAERLVRETPCDLVVAAMVGAAGLPAALAAVELGRDVALANKETLVAAGELVINAARRSGARLLPLDSEHSGLWQCLCGGGAIEPSCAPPAKLTKGVARLILTASGGPFRTFTREQLARVTPEAALRHPTWQMGPKNSIDSATLMNKGLELIEARWLFGLLPDQLDLLVHPQSIVHALVEMADGSILAQLGPTSMKSPIQWALTFPDRLSPPTPRLNLRELARLDFEPADLDRFPAPRLAFEAMRRGGAAGAILNAANEIAVGAFRAGRLRFDRISTLVHDVLETLPATDASTLEAVIDADRLARETASQLTSRA